MHPFTLHPDFYNKPIRLEKQVDPKEIVKHFFEDYRLSEIRSILLELLEVGLTTENDAYADGIDRSNLIHRYKRIEQLIEAAFLLNG